MQPETLSFSSKLRQMDNENGWLASGFVSLDPSVVRTALFFHSPDNSVLLRSLVGDVRAAEHQISLLGDQAQSVQFK